MNGQAIKQDFYILQSSDKPKTLSFAQEMNECCFMLPALAENEENPTDLLKNDKHSVIWFFNDLFTEATLTLQKNTGNDFADIDDLDSDTYGELFPFGFFENKFNEKAIGYKIDWNKVLLIHGEGDYRISITASPSLGDDFTDTSFEFCLLTYNQERAEQTCQITWYRNGELGDPFTDEKLNDYGTLQWFNQLRLPDATFGMEKSTFEREFVKYQSGAKIWVKDAQKEEFQLILIRYPEWLHRFIRINILQSDEIFITDFNSQNPTTHVNRKIIPSSEYAPKWTFGSKFASVEMQFQQYFENLTHKRD
jgi:hypothetical protein